MKNFISKEIKGNKKMIETKLLLYVIGALFILIGLYLIISTKRPKTKSIIEKTNKRTGKRVYGVYGMVTLILSVGFAGIAIGGAEDNVIGSVFIVLSAILLLFSLVLLNNINFKIVENKEC